MSSLDMALDEVISANKRRNRTAGGVNKRQGAGKNQSQQNRRSTAGGPIRKKQAPAPRGPRNSLLISNLHQNVTEKDLYDLFGQMGNVKRAFIHLAPTGKSSGVADVIYAQANDAERARNTYNNVQLDGRPMRIAFADLPAAVASALPINRRIQPAKNQSTRNQNSGNSRSGARTARRPAQNQRTGSGRPRRQARPKASQADLDADMDSYMAE